MKLARPTRTRKREADGVEVLERWAALDAAGFTKRLKELEGRCAVAQKKLGIPDEKRCGVFDRDPSGNFLTDLILFRYRQKKDLAHAREAALSAQAARDLRWLMRAFETGTAVSVETIHIALRCGVLLGRIGDRDHVDEDSFPQLFHQTVMRVKEHIEQSIRGTRANRHVKQDEVAVEVAKYFWKSPTRQSGYSLIKAAETALRQAKQK